MNLHAVKKTIKSGPFGGIATLLGDIYSAPISLISLMIKRPTSPTAILIGTPTHYNIGDHLIAYNAKCFLKRTCKYDSVIEIPTRIFAHNTKTIANIIKNDVSIFISCALVFCLHVCLSEGVGDPETQGETEVTGSCELP